MSPTIWGDSRDIALTPSSHSISYCNGKAQQGTLTESSATSHNAATVDPFVLRTNNVYLSHVVRVESSEAEGLPLYQDKRVRLDYNLLNSIRLMYQ
jgi:hypothetical protein